MPVRPLPLLVVVLMLLPAAPGTADGDHDRARRLRAAGEILPLEDILRRHREHAPEGRLLEVELDDDDGRLVYQVEVLGTDGALRRYEYDPRSGELLSERLRERAPRTGRHGVE